MKKTVYALVMIAALAFPSGLLAETSAFSDKVKVGGSMEAFGAAYFEGRKVNSRHAAENVYGEGRFLPYVKYKPNDKLFFYLQGDFRGDTAGYTCGAISNFAERTGRRWYANVREGYVEAKHNWLNVRVGKQIFDWSVADTTSPSDFFGAKDWTDIIRWERVGVPAAKVRLGYTSFIEIAYSPFFTPSKLPVNGGRWERQLPSSFENGTQEIPGRYRSQVGVRAGTTAAGFDLKAGYFNGYSYSPSVSVRPASPTAAKLMPIYRQQQVVTASVAREVKGFNIRCEAGYFSQKQDDNFVQLVAGVDRQWTGILGESDRLYVLVQYADELITKHGNPLARFGARPVDFRRALDGAVMAKVQYSPTHKLTLKLEGAYNVRNSDKYIEPAVAYRISNNVEIEAGVGIFSGPKSSFFGNWRDNDRVFVKTVFKF